MIKNIKTKYLEYILIIAFCLSVSLAFNSDGLEKTVKEYELNKPENRQILDEIIEKRVRATESRVQLGSFVCPASTGNYSVTGLSFDPLYVEFIVGRNSVDDIHYCHGRMDYSGNQHIVNFAAMDNEQRQWIGSGSYCIQLINTLGTADLIKAAYVSMNSDGYTVYFSAVNVNFTIFWKAVR